MYRRGSIYNKIKIEPKLDPEEQVKMKRHQIKKHLLWVHRNDWAHFAIFSDHLLFP